MTRDQAIEHGKEQLEIFGGEHREFIELAIKALEQESVLDKLDEIITDALDKSTDQKESQTLRWVLDKISEVT